MIGNSWGTVALGQELGNAYMHLCPTMCIDKDFEGPVNCNESCERGSHRYQKKNLRGSCAVKISGDVVGKTIATYDNVSWAQK